MKRNNIGARRHRAKVERHKGQTVDEDGNPTYTEPGDYETIVAAWPCEILTTGGSEQVGGRQVSASTTHMIYGTFAGGSLIEADMRLDVSNIFYSVTASYDSDGDRREWTVEAAREP